jgi:hypothetical protein
MVALNANVLIYACDKADASRQQVALDLISNANYGVLLWQVACEFVAASRKPRHQGFTTADAWNRLADYQAIVRSSARSSARALERARKTDGRSGTR